MSESANPVADPAADATDESDATVPVVETLHGCLVVHARDGRVLHVARERLVEVVRALRADGFWTCVDLAGVDYLAHERTDLPEGVTPERFEIVVMLRNHREHDRIRLRVQVPEIDPTVPSIHSVHPGVSHSEREAFDMFGIHFEGHPDLSRILMPDDWVGHPLRKDYDVGRIPVQFKGASSAP